MKTSLFSLGLLGVLLVFSLGLSTGSPAAAEEMDAGSVAIGKGLFRSYCASCHGRSGKGDGQVAQYMTPKPSDLTKFASRNKGDFDKALVAKIIDGREKVKGHGGKDMPVWGDAFQNTGGAMSEDEVAKRLAHLAAFLESVQQ